MKEHKFSFTTNQHKQQQLNFNETNISIFFVYHYKALFSSEKISVFGTVALSFVCDKYYPIMD